MTVKSIKDTTMFYSKILGMEVITFKVIISPDAKVQVEYNLIIILLKITEKKKPQQIYEKKFKGSVEEIPNSE